MKHRLFITTLLFLFYTLSNHYTAPATEETLVENNEASTPTGSDEPAMEDTVCQESFTKRPDSKCIIYADKECNDALGLKKMLKDERLTTLESGVLSVSIRNGCKLTIYGGRAMNGTSTTFNASETVDNHIVDVSVQFDGDVNSAYCNCYL